MKYGAGPLIVVAVLGLGACSTEATTSTQPEPTTSVAAQASQVVDAEKFASVIKEPNVVLIDVRTPEEFTEGHIEGAENINLNGPDFTSQVAELDKSKGYAIYCRSGNRSATAVDYFKQQGFTGLYDLSGGIISWESAGYPVV